MNYIPKFIEGLTVPELEAEINAMYELKYKYGYTIDPLRHCDLKHTIETLNTKNKRPKECKQ